MSSAIWTIHGSRRKRSTSPDELHLLHKRWFSAWTADRVAGTKEWICKQGDVNLEHELLENSADETFQVDIFFYQWHVVFRNQGAIDTALVFKAFAELRLPQL